MGFLARKLNAASSFGAELDSFADFVSFGVAPGILVYGYALNGQAAGFGWVFVLTFAVCACLRLARFNLSRSAPDGGMIRHFNRGSGPGGRNAWPAAGLIWAWRAGWSRPAFPCLLRFIWVRWAC